MKIVSSRVYLCDLLQQFWKECQTLDFALYVLWLYNKAK
jgi:hypothetical protein